MESTPFNLDVALEMLRSGLYAIVGHICFEAGVYGLGIALLLILTALVLRSTRYGVPLRTVSRKLAVCCGVMSAPGILILTITHHLPSTGAFQVSPLAFVIFWSWISLHLAAEEFNFEFF